MIKKLVYSKLNKEIIDMVKNTKTKEPVEEVFEPVLGELVSDDSFAFTLLSCHC